MVRPKIYPKYGTVLSDARELGDKLELENAGNLEQEPILYLAPEVARLEGLPGKWEEISLWDIVRHMSDAHAIVKDAPDWQPHKPEAWQEA